jgi:hypothetical protein
VTWTTSSWQTAGSTGWSATWTTPPFVGCNVYSPHPGGDRIFRGTAYRKNFTEDDELPDDALDTYVMLPKAGIREHLDPHAAAAEKAGTLAGSPWAGLHAELTGLFGADAVGIFGSAMLGMHLTPDGSVRKDVDFVIEGTGNIPSCASTCPPSGPGSASPK